MRLARMWALSRKEFLHILRDWRSLAMAIAIPILLLLLFGYALTLDVKNVPLIVWDQSQTPQSRDLVDRFIASQYFSLEGGYASQYQDIEKAIDTQDALIGLIIPREFAQDIHRGATAQIQVLVDGSDSNTATIAIGYAEALVKMFSQDLKTEKTPVLVFPIELVPRIWFNADIESKNNIVPGLIAVIMMVIAALLTSLTIAREWERGTMEQLISTPVKVPELVLGKMLPYFAIGMFDVLIAVLMGRFLFEVPLRGNVFFLFAMGAIFLSGALSLGMLISITAKSQLVANQLAMVSTLLPSFLLSGFLSPIPNMPEFIQGITYLIPARYFINILKGIFLKGIGLSDLFYEAAFLLGFACLAVTLAIRTFKKKLS